jgi:hypothetical protein
MRVRHWDDTLDGPLSEAAMRRKLESAGYLVSRYTYPPGTSFPEHSHQLDKIDAVLSGRFRMIVAGTSPSWAPATGWRCRTAFTTPQRWLATSPWSAWMPRGFRRPSPETLLPGQGAARFRIDHPRLELLRMKDIHAGKITSEAAPQTNKHAGSASGGQRDA